LIQPCGLEFVRRHHFLDAARHLRLRCTCRFDTGQHHAKTKVYASKESTAANLHDTEKGNRDSRMLAPVTIASRVRATEGAAVSGRERLTGHPSSITSDNICHIKSIC